MHRRDVLNDLTAAVRDENATQILVTGDLVHIGLPAEIEAAAAWLEDLGPPGQVMLVPGNHDAYAADSWRAVAAAWTPYLGIDAPAEAAAHDAFPTSRTLDAAGTVSLLGLSSARPSPLFMAYGRLGRAQLERFEARLAAAPGLRCVLLHHPPLPGMASWRKGLHDASALQAVLARQDAHLLLHGHGHRNVTRRGPGELRIFGTASASSSGGKGAAAYRRVDVAADDDGWHLDMRLIEVEAGGTAREIGREAWRVALRPSARATSAG